ncbi:MATE family efflux transporter [Poseidonibacter lekithochrous]|uniref:lipopolysaccharide biosynthesis protein n=1 Tax=Poseidonibacter lekithochrous TaxID=1904463 RepID=UPI000D3DB959|nr:lipopolysaccharide biosynthesis protein [Poseidonibacter lekithochrous]
MLVRNTIIYVILDIITKASALIILPLVTKNLSVENYGIYKIIMEMSILVVMISTFGIGSSISRYNFDKINMKRLYLIGYITSFLSIPFSIVFLSVLSFKYDIDIFISLIFSGIVFFTVFNSYTRIYFTINKKIKEFAIIKVFELSIFFISIALLDYFNYLNLYTLLISICGMIFTNTVLSYHYAKEIMNFFYKKSFYLAFKKIKTFSINSYYNGIIKYLNSNLEKFFFVIFLSGTQFGVYALAMTIGSIVRTSGSALFLSFAPIYYENNRQKRIDKNMKIYKLLFLLAPILYILFLYIVKFAWSYIIDNSYSNAYQYVSVLAFLYILEIYYGLAQYYYFQIKNTKFLLNFEIMFFCVYILTLLLVYFLIDLNLENILYLLVFISFIKFILLISKDRCHDMYKMIWLIILNILVLFLISKIIK